MQNDEGRQVVEAGERIAAGQGEAQWERDRCAGCFSELQIALDGMAAAIDPRDRLVEKPGAFAAIAEAKEIARAADATDQRAAQ